jgi:hypothetical protein
MANDPFMSEDSLDDPELGFGEEELVMEPVIHDVRVKPEPEALSMDANVPLDVEPDADLGSTVEFTDNSPSLESAAADDDIDIGDDFDEEESQLELQSLRAELQGLKDEHQALIEKNRELTERVEAAAPSGELSRLEGQLSEARKHHRQAEEELKALKRELEQAQAKASQLEEQAVDAAATVPDDTQRELDLMDAQIKALQTENTQLKEAL